MGVAAARAEQLPMCSAVDYIYSFLAWLSPCESTFKHTSMPINLDSFVPTEALARCHGLFTASLLSSLNYSHYLNPKPETLNPKP